MQTELPTRTHKTEPALNGTISYSYAADIGKLSKSLTEMRRARTPDSHALAVDAALNAATPTLHRMAWLFAASWPGGDVDVDILVHEALLEVAASLDTAPQTGVDILTAWLSGLAFATLHVMWSRALQVAIEDILAAAKSRQQPAA